MSFQRLLLASNGIKLIAGSVQQHWEFLPSNKLSDAGAPLIAPPLQPAL